MERGKGKARSLRPCRVSRFLSDLHSLSRDNQAFLHARLGLGPDPLAPYKAIISRWPPPQFGQTL